MLETMSKEQVQPGRSYAGILWRLFRPHTLTASFIPVLVGSVLAWRTTRRLDLTVLGAMLAACTLIQAATNMWNEYFDYVRGLDTAESVGIAGAITQEGVAPKTVRRLAIGCLLAAAMLGVYLCASSSWWLAAVGALSMLVGFLYTGGPWPIAASPFGELFAGGFMGCGIVLIACFVQRGAVNWTDLAVSVPLALLIGAILTANNIRDRAGDRENGRRTLAILLGHRGAVIFLAATILSANLWVAGLVAYGLLPARALLALGSLWPGGRALRIFRSGGTPAEMMPAMQWVARTNTVFGLLLLAGML